MARRYAAAAPARPWASSRRAGRAPGPASRGTARPLWRGSTRSRARGSAGRSGHSYLVPEPETARAGRPLTGRRRSSGSGRSRRPPAGTAARGTGLCRPGTAARAAACRIAPDPAAGRRSTRAGDGAAPSAKAVFINGGLAQNRVSEPERKAGAANFTASDSSGTALEITGCFSDPNSERRPSAKLQRSG